jgi:hypothetical protein
MTVGLLDLLHPFDTLAANLLTLLRALFAGLRAILAGLGALFARLRTFDLAVSRSVIIVAAGTLGQGRGNRCAGEEQCEEEITHTDLCKSASHLKNFCARPD